MKNVKDYFSRLGRAFIPAVAIMSCFALFLSIGAVMKNPNIINVAPFLKGGFFVFVATVLNEMGLVVIKFMPLVFAVSIAVGLTKKAENKGIAGLSSVIGYLFMITFSYVMLKTLGTALPANVSIADDNFFSIGQTFEMRKQMQSVVLGMQIVDSGVVGGIIIGTLAAYSTNKFTTMKLPLALSFYQGKHFPPIITGIFATVVGLLTPIIWPVFGQMIYFLAEGITNLGFIGSFLFGFIERLLIPTGLHHIWYSLAHFTPIGGEVEICGEVYVGTKAITTAALSCAEYKESLSDVTRLWLGQGATPIKLFGIPGALLAMYVTAKDKKRAGAIAISAGAATIFAGVTEPFEFLFMFLSPILFLIHAIFTGISFMILDIVNASYLGGNNIFELIINGVLQGHKSTWIPVVIVGIAMFSAYFFVFKWFILKYNIATPGRDMEDEDIVSQQQREMAESRLMNQTKDKIAVAKYILTYVGGAENVEETTNCISRLRLFVKDMGKVDETALKNTPDSLGYIQANENELHIVFGVKVSEYAEAFENVIEKEGK